MLRRYQLTIGATARVLDAAIIAGIWLASFGLRFYAPVIEVTKGFPAFSSYAAVTPLVVVLWTLAFSAQAAYRPQNLLSGPGETIALLKSHCLGLICFIALTYVFIEYRYSRGVLLYFGVLGFGGLVAGRTLLRAVFRLLRRTGIRTRRVLLVGDGSSVDLLVEKLHQHLELGLEIRGMLVSDRSAVTCLARIPVLGTFEDVVDVVRNARIDKVLIALSRQQWTALDPILDKIQDEIVDIQIVTDLHEYVTIGCEVEDFDGIPMVSLNESPLLGIRALTKRMTDMALSALALIVLSPLLCLIAAAVKVTSPGPVLYRQDRMGLDGLTFPMFKFRSMRVDAESETGAVWARKGDDRRTPIGAFLRATSLDELPQFWNVLVGDMSLVGPRPERPIFVNQFRGSVLHYMLRHKVKAGITGWAQVNGWRGDTSLDERIRCDLHYIRNWSYYLDVKILFLTVLKGFINRNAY
jgi:Undecaprenyl-phosphate glucose phosphotransferase